MTRVGALLPQRQGGVSTRRRVRLAKSGAALAVALLAAPCASQADSGLPLVQRVLKKSDVPAGFRVVPPPIHVLKLTDFERIVNDPQSREADAAQARKCGYSGAVVAQFRKGSAETAGFVVSLVVRCATPAKAKALMRYEIPASAPPQGDAVRSTLSGVPGGVVVDITGNGPPARQIFFTEGRYLYFVFKGGGGDVSFITSLGRALYRRVH